MALTHSTAARNAMATAYANEVNGGSGSNPAVQVTKVAGDYSASNLLAEITTQSPPFTGPSVGALTWAGLPLTDSSANNSGVAVEARTVNKDGVEVSRGTVTVTGGGGDYEMPNTTVVVGEPVQITGGGWIAPP